jgi:hypothetical protein
VGRYTEEQKVAGQEIKCFAELHLVLISDISTHLFFKNWDEHRSKTHCSILCVSRRSSLIWPRKRRHHSQVLVENLSLRGPLLDHLHGHHHAVAPPLAGGLDS